MLDGRPRYEVTFEGEKFHERKWKRPYEKALKKWRDKMEPRIKAVRDSTRLTEEDLQVYINT